MLVHMEDLRFNLREKILESQFLLFQVLALDLSHKHEIFSSEVELVSLCDP